MFIDLEKENIQPKITDFEAINEIPLPNSLIMSLASAFKKEENQFVNVEKYTTCIQVDKNYIFFPNQYYYIATLCKKYAFALKDYFDFFDKNIRNNEILKNCIIKKDFKNISYCSLFSNKTDEILFTRFLSDSDYRQGKEIVNSDKFRSSKDIFSSCILKKVPLPDASSTYFGNIVYYLTHNPGLYAELEEKYSFIQNNQSSKVPDVSLNYSQIIYYGVPGAGKSHKIEEEIKKSIPSVQDREYQVLRVVFHPDYTNADFEGQILPGVADGNIRYEFKPGPFTKILKRAYENPEKPFYLVIEEINRGNAAAIFGDIFQLLDRLTDDENNNIGGNTYTKGWSKYFIENDFINAYLRNKKEYSDSAYKDNDTESAKTFFQNITFTSNTGIRLPPNLSLLATMNTSDQNVFALDNAFQRRWDLRLVPNEIPEDSMQYNAEIENTGIKWGKFMDWANRKISESNNFTGTGSMEDRCLGAYFVIHDGRGKIQSKIFAEKVIKYLWDDVFRMERETFFIMEKGESFGSITKRFYKNHSLQEIFKDFEIPENAEYKKESLGYVT